MSFGGRSVESEHLTGLGDIARLLAEPGQAIAAPALAGDEGRSRTAAARRAVRRTSAPRQANELQRVRRRLVELRRARDQAELERDEARRRAIDRECRSLFRRLNALPADKTHRADDPLERARKRVGKRIREAIARLRAVHPDLARHLQVCIHTGTFCLYWPAQRIEWKL